MSNNKTVANTDNVLEFLNTIEQESKRKDCFGLLEIFKQLTGEPPVMWGKSIVGFGKYHYKYESGREGDFFLSGFSPRTQNLTLYIMPGFQRYEDLMIKLGKHKTGKSCLYIKRLSDIDLKILEELIALSVEHMQKKYPAI